MSIENLPYACLIWITIGVGIMLLGVIVIASVQTKDAQYTRNLEKVFPMLMEQKQFQIGETHKHESSANVYEQIQQLSQEGKSEEEIAKQLKIGVGEVRLMQSLYAMR